MAAIPLFVNQIIDQTLEFFGATWFLWAPIVLYFVFWETWVAYVRANFISNLKWMLLEIKIPKEVAKSPKAMENFLAGIHGSGKGGNLLEKYWDGWLTPWFSLEIVGDRTGVHFYIWCQKFFKRMIESQVYAQYPASEIKEVEDYTRDVPSLPVEGWNMWGTEFILTKPDAYPIRTYEDFPIEDISAKEEERKIDPLSSLIEYFGTLRNSERLWLQIVIQPMGDKWKKEGEALVAKLAGKEVKPPTPPFVIRMIGVFFDTVATLLGLPTAASSKKQENQFRMLNMSPGEINTIKAIENNITKFGLETGIRWMYIAKKEDYNTLSIPSMFGIFRQFSSQTLNGFKPNGERTTSADYFFVNTRVNMRKNWLFNAYQLRSFFHPPYKSDTIVLSSTELATIYHFPGMVAGAPSMERIEAKRGAPPPNLPV
ncbi:hypothetical protein HYS99_01070 [Candidatus Giovannonibacteria bacterium]|nr:hypothetical protein [Candidatus Giovannonibacteria bacterium]